MDRLWQSMRANQFDVLKNTVTDIVFEGYPMNSILAQMHDDLIGKSDIPDVDKALICTKIAESEQGLIDGANEELQLLDVAAFIMRRFMHYPCDVDARSASNH